MEPLTPLPPPAPPIVLIVEDDADTREMYHAALEFDGFWVVDTSLANDAVVRAAEIRPDIIVTDIGLNGPMDGVSLAQQLRSDARTSEIPLLAITGRDPRTLGEKSALFEDVLLKPVLPDHLSQKIKDTLERSRALSLRSAAARAKVPELLARSHRLLNFSEKMAERAARMPHTERACPGCGVPMVWVDCRTRRGVSFDYYRPCENGCGRFCYNRRERRIVPLAE